MIESYDELEKKKIIADELKKRISETLPTMTEEWLTLSNEFKKLTSEIKQYEENHLHPSPFKNLQRYLNTKQITHDEYQKFEKEIRMISTTEKIFIDNNITTSADARKIQIFSALKQELDIRKEVLGINFIFIPPGRMINELTITRPFYISENLITEFDWLRIMDQNLSLASQNPKSNIDICDIKKFLKIANNKLTENLELTIPTSIQWEFASCFSNIKTASGFQVYDLIGKLWQFCRTERSSYEICGGSYKSHSLIETSPPKVSCSSSMLKDDDIGFRPTLEIFI